MRFASIVALVAVLGCKNNKSKLDEDRGSDADALWGLAPEGTQLAIVATPRAVGLAMRAAAAVRQLAMQPDFSAAKPQIDNIARRMFGSETATPADAGLSPDRAFAMFATGEGVLALMPVGDRDKFLQLKSGTRGSAEDTIDATTCRIVRNHYICATNVAMFDLVGSGKMRGKLTAAGARGDVELFMANATLMGDTTGELAIAAQIDEGQISVYGSWIGKPSAIFEQLIGVTAPHPETKGASGFASINVAPLIGELPPLPIAGDVTLDVLAKTLVGPVSAMIPAGSVDIQVFAPLSDPKPATTVIENCPEVGRFLAIAEKQVPGACRLQLQGTNSLELDAWVDGTTLRLGAKKGPPPAGQAGALTAIGRELAKGDWTATLWGRGTMLNLTGITPTTAVIEPQVALGVHALALVNELGLGLKVEPGAVRFRGYLRTAWTNKPDLIAAIVAFSGEDIVSGKATEPAKALAAKAPGSPFADDFAAGQGGLMVPAATIGIASAVVVPLILQAFGEPSAQEQPPQGEQMDDAALVSLLVRAYVEEAYPKWQAEHKGTTCPKSLDDVAKYFGDSGGVPVITDPWGHPLQMKCDADGFKVFSIGPDSKAGTDDDVRSW